MAGLRVRPVGYRWPGYRSEGSRSPLRRRTSGVPAGIAADLPVFVSLFVTIGAVLSLVAIMAIYLSLARRLGAFEAL